MVVITKSDIGGAQVHVLQILRELGDEYDFILVTGEEGFLTMSTRELGIPVVICRTLVRPIRPHKDLLAVLELVRLIRRHRPEFVHAHSFKSGVVARLAARWAGVPTLFTAHGWAFTPGVSKGQLLIGLLVEALLCRMCAGVITISKHDYLLAAKHRIGPPSTRYLVPNAAEAIGAIANPETTPVKLLCVGRLTRAKNHSLLLKAMHHLPEEVTLTIVGEGFERHALERLRTKLGLEHRVMLLGEVLDIEPYLEAAQIFTLSSNYEGLPISVLEAMSAGLPVVSTDVGGVSEAVIQGSSGLLVKRGDLQQLINSLNTLIADPSLRSRFGQEGRVQYQKHYMLARFIEQMRDIYRKMPTKN
ncbi:MAG: glycosyltransferase family 4 protein [bacterium]